MSFMSDSWMAVNPRTEEPKAIIDDILEGMKDSDTPMQVIVDRPEAIHWALAHAQKDDIIVLMGKGHETYQEVNGVQLPMDEREIVADWFREQDGRKDRAGNLPAAVV